MSGAWKRQVKRCESKKKFYSLSEANKFIEELTKNKKNKDKLGTPKYMRPYLCKVCKKLHVGHIPFDNRDRFIK